MKRSGVVGGERPSVVEREYNLLSRKLKYLLYEKEIMGAEMRDQRRKIIRLSQEKDYILSRLAQTGDLSDSGSDGFSSDAPLNHYLIKQDINRAKEKEKDIVKAEKPAQSEFCLAQPCKNNPIGRLNYCRRHAPLDPDSQFIYCTYVDDNEGSCKHVMKKGMSTTLCPTHKSLLGTRVKRKSGRGGRGRRAAAKGRIELTPTENRDDDDDDDENLRSPQAKTDKIVEDEDEDMDEDEEDEEEDEEEEIEDAEIGEDIDADADGDIADVDIADVDIADGGADGDVTDGDEDDDED
eukprot:CFRG5443T1